MAPWSNAIVVKSVTEACRINRQIKALQAELDVLKKTIREAAENLSELDASGKRYGKVEFETLEGVCTVSFPKDKVSLLKDVDPEELRGTVMSMQLWDSLFDTKVILAPTFEEKLPGLSKGMRKVVLGLVEFKESTPAVTLPK